MKKFKLLPIIILIITTCTGCTIEYNINISQDSIKEVIKVNDYITSTRTESDILNHYNTWYPTFVNYVTDSETIEIEDFSQKVSGIEYHDKKIENIGNGYQYTYTYNYDIEDYYDSYVLANAFIETTIQPKYSSLVLKTSRENLLCQYSYFDSVKVNITIDPNVYELNYTNTSNIKNNTYSWTLDRNNCQESQILLTLNNIENANETIDKENNDKVNNITNSNYIMYIFYGALILLILIGWIIFTKYKKKNENFDIDD